jgi:hypothetical protein
VIDDDRRALVEEPSSLVVGTVAADLLPDATRGWGACLDRDARELRLLLSASATTSLDNVGTTGVIAVTATEFHTNESVQLKGRVTSVEDATGDDRERFAAFCDGVVDAVSMIDGVPPDVVRKMLPEAIVACVVVVDEVFDQTPGPSAGTRLVATGT